MLTGLLAIMLGFLGAGVILRNHRSRQAQLVPVNFQAQPPARAVLAAGAEPEPEPEPESEEEIPVSEAEVVDAEPVAVEAEPVAVKAEPAEPELAEVEAESEEPELAEVEPEPELQAAEPEPERPGVEPEPELPAVDPVRAHRVMTLQRQLAALGFAPGPIDGRFGPRTTAAVRRLQETSGLEPDGMVGPLTAAVLRRSAPEPPSDDRAQRVQALQRQLAWLGFEPGPTDGRYGPLTTGAVKRFQEAAGLPADGIVDRTTADVLRASVAQRPSSDRIDRVKALQRQLLWLDLEPGAVDGRYGPQTAEAVRRFQEENDLPADGIVGPATQQALQQSVQRTAQW
jgi:peptidoglycan hydrolase-like protein with peptidoglycan-binding domain